MRFGPALILSPFALTALLTAATQPAGTPEFFESRIRPVLATNCYPCHTNSQLGGLRLDSREAMLKGGATGPALVPGDSAKSLLIQAILQTGELKMPKGGKLQKEQIDDLTEWVKAGGTWGATAPVVSTNSSAYTITPEQRAFWSFQPLKAVTVPPVKETQWAHSDIDRFILARLEKENMKPVRAASKRNLIRRATLDLTGLPPTTEEIEAFENDKSPDAFAKVVDRLLESPHYGERWGRLWLDVARYGEDDYRSLDPMGRGYNPYPNAYLYRDWTVKAFNADMPYDQFVKAQLAADQLDPKDRVRMLPALGFLGQGPWYYDNGAVEVTHADERHDRVDAVTRGFLGLTVACARCHDHKYDPIPTKDYYSLAGVFASTLYHEYPQMPKSKVAEYDTLEKRVKSKEKLLGEIQQNESAQLAETLALQVSKYMQAAWRVMGEPKEPINTVVENEKLDYELLERYTHFLAKPPKFYPYLTKWQAMIQRGGTAKEAQKLADEFQATVVEVMFEKREMKDINEVIVAKSLPASNKPKERNNKPSDFVTNEDFCPGCALELKTLAVERMNLWTDVFQRDLTGEDEMNMDFRSRRSGLLSFRGWSLERQLSPEKRAYLDVLRADIEKTRKALPAKYPFVHGVEDAEQPVDLAVSKRGSPYNLGDIEKRHFLSILTDGKPEAFTHGSGRMELANDIVRQPIAMRVYVNRIWKGHFGTGLVDTPSNFGVAGERPSNPGLLEYLAKQFVDEGMSTKKLHRAIMLSATYQLSSEDHPENFAKDSANRLYWRFNKRRMDAEQIRDSLLQVSGSLDPKLYGPSDDLKPSFKRRTLYGKVSRYHLDDYLSLFDFPSPASSAEKRFATNVPLQRLFFMNSDFVQEQGELLAKRVSDAPDNTARVTKTYKILFGREPNADEMKLALEYLRAEPMKEYEERKVAKAAKEKEDREKKDAALLKAKAAPVPDPAKGAALPGKVDGGHPAPVVAKVEAPPAAEATAETETASAGDKDDTKVEEMKPGQGMMAGMNGGSREKGEAKPMSPVTIFGRYAKILMSSPEFTFIN